MREQLFSKYFSSLGCPLPVSTATPGRSFSALRGLKNWLEGSSGQKGLSGLALLAVSREIDVCHEKVVDVFAGKKNRHLDFIF